MTCGAIALKEAIREVSCYARFAKGVVFCQPAPPERAACTRRAGDSVEEVYPDRYLAVSPISVETMPMLHFHPGAKFLQISTIGCNFECPGCISAVVVKEIDPSSRSVRQIPRVAYRSGSTKAGL